MGIVSWLQSRLGGRTAAESRGLAAGNHSVVAAVVAAGKERNHHQQVTPEDLAGDDQQWPPPAPSNLFSIGTLGYDELLEQVEEEDLPEFSVEEVRKLQDALARLLLRASLEVDRRAQRGHNGGGGLSPETKMILTKAKDLLVDGNSRSTTTTSDIKNKSFKFLVKQIFVCHGGCFVPAPSLKDPTESTMEKTHKGGVSEHSVNPVPWTVSPDGARQEDQCPAEQLGGVEDVLLGGHCFGDMKGCDNGNTRNKLVKCIDTW
ncbi:hypothetical protein E2562_037258 [Oryza meyeriana var. granulata]|uniref:Uncharacterized protein n=1 Tax=Oryza meyeriana var. granulata TaxID=110450 RepID=A0A6G1EEV6_9ORYZ|nr:hypothetical protein E2562_037258 [Oryza meyeriana var. granulata]